MESDLASGSGRCHNVPLIGSGARRERAAQRLGCEQIRARKWPRIGPAVPTAPRVHMKGAANSHSSGHTSYQPPAL